MTALTQLLTILTGYPGSMVYYLVLLFSIWAIVGLALSQWTRGERHGRVARWLVAGGLMSFGRLALMILALFDRPDTDGLAWLLPPLERLMEALSIVIIGWALVLNSRRRTLSQILVGVTALVFVGFYIIAAMQWATAWQSDTSLAYNLSWQRWVWHPAICLLLVLMLAYLGTTPAPQRGILMVALSALTIGHLAQAIFPLLGSAPHLAGWVRLANLIAFPILAVSVLRAILSHHDAQTAELRAISQESLARVTGLMDMVDAVQKITVSTEMDAVLENATQILSQMIPAHLCAIALTTPTSNGSPSSSGEMLLPIVYSANQISHPQTHLLIRDYPIIEYTVNRRKSATLQAGEGSQVSDIYRLLGSDQTGPVIAQPMDLSPFPCGVILIARPGHARSFNEAEIHKSETLCKHIATMVRHARRYQDLEDQINHQKADQRLLEMEFARTRADLENRLRQSQQEMTVYIQKLYEAETGEQRAQNDLRELRAQLNQTKAQSQKEVRHLEDELETSMKRLALLTSQIGKLDATRLQLSRRVQTLEQEQAAQRDHVARLEQQRDELLQRVAELKTASSQQPAPPQLDTRQAQARDEFLNSLAQELRTPMTSIIGYTELLLGGAVGKLETMPRKFLQRVQANIERMNGMLNDMIGVTAIDSGKLTIDLEPVSVPRLIETALQKAQYRMEEKELQAHLDIAELPELNADPECLQQILDNLLANACKSSQPGSTIHLKAFLDSRDNGQSFLHVTISDTGGGIAPTDWYRVFERFYRADDTLIAGLGETGVGLAIVKAMVEAHQGLVWIESQVGAGTTFHFTIPYHLQTGKSVSLVGKNRHG